MDPWFDPLHAWIPGTFLGVSAGIFGSICGICAPKGVRRTLILNIYRVFMVISALLLMAGLIALQQGQPYGVWYGLALGGGIGCAVLIPNYFTVRRQYQQAELRRIDASSLSTGS